MEPSTQPDPPPRAFTQGVGTLFQFAGVSFFLVMLFICCGSSLLGKQTATQSDLNTIGWNIGTGDLQYSAQRALAICVTCGVFFGMAVAGVGLGLQAQNRGAPAVAISITAFATLFWLGHCVFFALAARLAILAILCMLLALGFAILLGFSIAAFREMRRTPPPPDLEVLPADYKVPYSHLHQDPPEVRLARELDERRAKLKTQQQELHMLEEKLKRKLQQSSPEQVKKDQGEPT